MYDRRIRNLELWRIHMDAQVTALLANIATLQTNVAGVTTEIGALLAAQAKAIDDEDEKGITDANAALVDLNTKLAALAAGVVPGASGASGATGATGAPGATGASGDPAPQPGGSGPVPDPGASGPVSVPGSTEPVTA